MSASSKTVRKLLRELDRNHPEVQVEQGGKHYRVMRGDEFVCSIPITPSDARAIKNCCAVLRRRGVPIRTVTG